MFSTNDFNVLAFELLVPGFSYRLSLFDLLGVPFLPHYVPMSILVSLYLVLSLNSEVRLVSVSVTLCHCSCVPVSVCSVCAL